MQKKINLKGTEVTLNFKPASRNVRKLLSEIEHEYLKKYGQWKKKFKQLIEGFGDENLELQITDNSEMAKIVLDSRLEESFLNEEFILKKLQAVVIENNQLKEIGFFNDFENEFWDDVDKNEVSSAWDHFRNYSKF